MSKISFLKNYPEVKILSGKKIAENSKKQIAGKIKKIKTAPTLAVILVGQNSASSHYVAIKKKFAQEVGVKFYLFHYPSRVKEKTLIEKINQLNRDKKINGILVQLPLPKNFSADEIINTILPQKDVDGFGRQAKITPGLDLSIIKLIRATKQNLKGKFAIIVAKSKLFSESLAKLLTKEKIKVTGIKPNDSKLSQKTKKADLLISAVGKPNLIKDSMVKKGAIIIDIGTTYKNGKIYGDVSNEAVKFASAATPVPGGVGPLTVAMLFVNLIKLTKLQNRSL
jgi:methylenetetrahydrofolate dehydrogenase (NADP+)/methenyltetrahydrofolate cyclohydrolase